MQYQNIAPSGSWAKNSELKSGTRAKIVSETKPQSSRFKDDEGKEKMQDVCKVKFEGKLETLNVSLNRATIGGLVEAFGAESADWQNKVLRVETEKMRVGGRAVTALYLIPEGFKKIDDENGYAVIVKEEEERRVEKTPDQQLDELASDEPNPEDIPF